MKVLHLLSGATFGGMERQAERLVTVLESEGFDQRVILAENPTRSQRLAAAGAIPFEIPFPSRFAFLDRRRINSTIQRFAPDLVVSWMHQMAAMVEEGNFIHLGRIPAGVDIALLAKCAHLFSPSTSRAGLAIAAGWPSDKVHTLPSIPSLEKEPVPPANRKTYFTPPTARLVVTAIRLVRNCGLEVLLESISRLSGYYLWIVGDGADRAVLENIAHERGVKPRVRFLGWQDDLRPFIAAADVFVYPARQDDSGDTIAEAWALGAPVISSDSLGPGLTIKHQENGLLIPVGDAVSMAEAIKWVCQDNALARRLGEAGRIAFNENFAAEKIVPRYVELFKQLAARPSPQL